MPKSRRSNNVGSIGTGYGSGSGSSNAGSDGEEAVAEDNVQQELADRLSERLNGARTVTVNVESRTRRRNEEVQVTLDPNSFGSATVHSESGSDYNVDYVNNTCTCMHYRINHENCRHIDAAHQAIGEVIGQRNIPGTVGQPLENTANAVTNQQQLDINSEEARRALSGEHEDDNYFYSDHPEEVTNIIEGRSEDIPYDYANALNGSNITFGVELEFVGGDADAIARELYDLGVCAYESRVRYHAPSVSGKWKLERDGSVTTGSGGGELVSPVLQDTPETWRNIEVICEVAKRHGARVDSHTGAHVHMGMEPLDTARQRWKRFFKTMSSHEECIYRIAGGDQGHIRSGHEHYAMPFADRARAAENLRFQMNDTEDVERMASRVSDYDRYYAVNLTNICDERKPNTVEFRYFNGSLNPKTIQANIKLANGIMMASKNARTKDIEGSMKRRGEMLKNETSYSERSQESIINLVDIAFSRKKDKDHILNVFAQNTWRE